MSAATTAKAAPSAAAIEEMGWAGLEHLARTSNNREVLAAVVHAANIFQPAGNHWLISNNTIVSHIVRRAADNRWADVLEAAVDSGAMGSRDYIAILAVRDLAPENVHAAILREVRGHGALLATFHRATPYAALKEIALRIRLASVAETLAAIKADGAAFELDEDGDEDVRFSAAVTIAFELDRLDLVTALIKTGYAGSLTIDRAQMVTGRSTALETAVLNYLYEEKPALAA